VGGGPGAGGNNILFLWAALGRMSSTWWMADEDTGVPFLCPVGCPANEQLRFVLCSFARAKADGAPLNECGMHVPWKQNSCANGMSCGQSALPASAVPACSFRPACHPTSPTGSAAQQLVPGYCNQNHSALLGVQRPLRDGWGHCTVAARPRSQLESYTATASCGLLQLAGCMPQTQLQYHQHQARILQRPAGCHAGAAARCTTTPHRCRSAPRPRVPCPLLCMVQTALTAPPPHLHRSPPGHRHSCAAPSPSQGR